MLNNLYVFLSKVADFLYEHIVLKIQKFFCWILKKTDKYYFVFTLLCFLFFYVFFYYYGGFIFDFYIYCMVVLKDVSLVFFKKLILTFIKYIKTSWIYNSPSFYFFFILFFITSTCGVFFMSYLGIYGVFKINFFPIIFLYLSVFYYINYFFLESNFILTRYFKIMTYHNIDVFFDLSIDNISYSFFFLTITIFTFVYFYLFSYFRYEPNVERLLLMINFFVISMSLLVSAGNIITMFLGWELIGLTSFFLINFWNTRINTLKSAFKAYCFNKFSDVCFLTFILFSASVFNDFHVENINNNLNNCSGFSVQIGFISISYINLLSFFLMLCAFTKSAQFGFHTWLPDSMEAPVPASALIHSATLVSAGIYLMLRFAPLLELSSVYFLITPIISSFTAFFGGICSAYQSDTKRILAYSTISHCGFLMLSTCFLFPEVTVIYLYIHGFFKASVFLCAGNIIRMAKNYQDFRKMGNFYKILPFEFYASFISLFNLSGLPFSLGFYMKHYIVITICNNFYFFFFVYFNTLCASLCGIFYSFRFLYYIFFDFKKFKKKLISLPNNVSDNVKWYKNTTTASKVSISLLILVSYAVSYYLIINLIDFKMFNKRVDNYTFINVNAYYLFIESYFKNINSYFLNILVIFFFLFNFFISFRINSNSNKVYYNYLFIFNCIVLVILLL